MYKHIYLSISHYICTCISIHSFIYSFVSLSSFLFICLLCILCVYIYIYISYTYCIIYTPTASIFTIQTLGAEVGWGWLSFQQSTLGSTVGPPRPRLLGSPRALGTPAPWTTAGPLEKIRIHEGNLAVSCLEIFIEASSLVTFLLEGLQSHIGRRKITHFGDESRISNAHMDHILSLDHAKIHTLDWCTLQGHPRPSKSPVHGTSQITNNSMDGAPHSWDTVVNSTASGNEREREWYHM